MLLLIGLYLILPAVQIAFYLPGQLAFGFFLPDVLNYISSIILLHWLLSNIIIAAKLPWMQKHVPYDKRIRFHILSSIGIVILLIYHTLFKILSGYSLDPVTILLGVTAAVIVLSALLWIPVPGFLRIRKILLGLFRAGKEGNYERNKGLHRFLVPVLALLIFLHVFSTGIMLESGPVSSFLFFGIFIASVGLFFFSKNRGQRIPAEVVGITSSRDILTVKLKPVKEFRYKPGQFTFFGRLNEKGRREEHPFSFLSSGESDFISLGIRQVGDFTENLGSLKSGDSVWLRGAYGGFRPGNEDSFCLIGSGIGIVPLMSIVRNMVETGDRRPVKLFLAVNSRDEIPDRTDFLETIEGSDNIELHLLVFEEDSLFYSAALFSEILNSPRDYSYYLCSSPAVRKSVAEALKSLGVRKRKIHFEAFSFG